jgi:hypothetical protein
MENFVREDSIRARLLQVAQELGREADELRVQIRERDERIAVLERKHAVLQINHANLMARVREAGLEISEIDEST